MSGYKRVNFYELCRLCASNHQKEKTHIFQEEGRKIQLQNKIQSCLSLTVCENDFLPKVVCSQCLRILEECYVFRKECVTSETMLSSYFNNFRYTEDFKKSGKVYIKDTSGKNVNNEQVTSTTSTNVTNYAESVKTTNSEQLPLYTVQFPVQNQQTTTAKQTKIETANKHQNLQLYQTNSLQLKPPPKINVADTLSNIAVNSNGEIISLAQLVDIDALINQSNVHKYKNVGKSAKSKPLENVKQDESVIKIDLTQPDLNASAFEAVKYEKSPLVKGGQTNKFTYTIKLEDTKANHQVILNQINDLNGSLNNGQNLPQFNIGGFNNVGFSGTGQLNQAGTLNYPTTTTTTPNISASDLNVFNGINGKINYNCRTNPLPTITTNQNLVACNNPVSSNSNNFITNKSITVQSQQGLVNGDVKLHVCDVCKKTFKRREHLFQHVKLHTGFRPFTCENCNKSFMRKEHLLRHMTSHSGQKNFTCNICEKSFSRNDNLLKHKKTHDKQSSFTCEVCQKQFIMKHYYLAHKVMHENDKCNNVNQVWGLLKA